MFILKKYGLTLTLLVLFSLIVSASCYSQTPNKNKFTGQEILGSYDSKYLDFYKKLPSDKKALNELLITNLLHPELAKIILLIQKGADVNIKRGPNQSLDTPLVCAIKYGNVKQMEWMVAHGANLNPDDLLNQPMYEALQIGDIEKIKFLLDHGVNPDTKNYHGYSPLVELNFLSSNRNEEMNLKKKVEIAKIFIDHGANVNDKGGYQDGKIVSISSAGNNPLSAASSCDNLELVRLLIKHGADVNIRDMEANTPLHNALFVRHFDVARELIANGANVKARNIRGATPLSSLMGGVMVKEDKYTQTDDLNIVKLLLEKGADIKQMQDRGYSLLSYAIWKNNIPVFELLIKHGASINPLQGDRPITYYLGLNYYEILKPKTLQEQLTLAKLLVANGVKINKNDLRDIENLNPEVLDYLNSIISEPLTKQELEQIKKMNAERLANSQQYQTPEKTTKKQPPKQTSKKKSK